MFFLPQKVWFSSSMSIFGGVNGNDEDHPKRGPIQKEMNCLEQQNMLNIWILTVYIYASCVLKSVPW